MIRRAAFLISALSAPLAAQLPPPDRPFPESTIVVATETPLAPRLAALIRDYRTAHPDTTVQIDLVGSDVAMAELASGER